MSDHCSEPKAARTEKRETQNHATLEALREAELRYRMLADFAHDWGYWLHPDGTLGYVSPSCERITGYPPERFLRDPILLTELVVPDDRERWAEHLRAVAAQRPQALEVRIQRHDGQIRWIEHVCQPVRDGQGVFLGRRASNRDITERKRTEEELRKLSRAVEQSPSMVVVTDTQGDIEYVNPKFTEITGYSPQDVLGRNTRLLKSGKHPPESYRELWEAILAGREWRGELINQKANGELYWEHASISPVRDAQGVTTHFVKVAEDVTEQMVAAETRSRLAAIVESSDDAIIGKTLAGIIASWNAGAERIYGYSAEEMIGQPVSILLPPDRADEVKQILQALEEGKRVDHFETVRVAKDGRRVEVSLNVSPIKDETGKVIGASTIARDISRRKRVEQELKRATRIAQAAQQAEEKRRQEADRRRQIAESLSDVLTALNSNQSLDRVLDLIAVQARQLLGPRAVGIYRLEDEAGTLAVQAAQGLLVTYVAGANIPIGQGALRQAMVSRRAVAIPDTAAVLSDGSDLVLDAGRQALAGYWASVYRAMLAVPIADLTTTYGGMLLYYAQPRVFSEDDMELAVLFGNQVALAMGNAHLREQAEQAAASAERSRLARELHDAVTQTLFSASLIAAALPSVWEHNPEEGQQGLEELRQLTRGALAEMRTMLLELRPAALTEKPLGELLRHLTAAVTSRTRVPVALTVVGERALPPDVQIILYRIAQEALNNVAKHASASQATVDLQNGSKQVDLRIQDDGRGFKPGDILPGQMGLGIMQERAESVGAVLHVNSKPGLGTDVMVSWLDPKER